jgi:hypothetical protein
VELLRVEGEGKSGVVVLLRHYARCGITRTNTVVSAGGAQATSSEENADRLTLLCGYIAKSRPSFLPYSSQR